MEMKYIIISTYILIFLCTFDTFRNKTESGWGPNAVFRFPQHGGTGGIWKKVSILNYSLT